MTFNRDKLSESEMEALRLFRSLGKYKPQILLDLVQLFARDYKVGLDDPEVFNWTMIGAKKKLTKAEDGSVVVRPDTAVI